MWTPPKRRDRRPTYRWSFPRYPWTIQCEKHPGYKIGTGSYTLKINEKVSRPRNDCDTCWQLYYNWFAAKNPDVSDISLEVGECESWRQKMFNYTPRRRAWAASTGIDRREIELLKSLQLDNNFIEGYSRRSLAKEIRGDDWVTRALQRKAV